LFSGDTLLINGCGRTDFQNGDPEQLYDSITQKLFLLDADTIVFPGHDYNNAKSTTIADQKKNNPRLANKSKGQFIDIMNNLNLPTPKLMDVAVPLNLKLGKE
jgi:glyoxylase-like metal-dependent hydrolase (beta-lactamase superfamily II)